MVSIVVKISSSSLPLPLESQLESPRVRNVPFEPQVSVSPYFHPCLLRPRFRGWSGLDRRSAAIRRFLVIGAISFFENKLSFDSGDGRVCLRRDEQQVGQQVRDVVYPCAPVCASAAAAALRVWSIAPSSPLRDPGNPARTPSQPPFARSR